MRFGKGGNGRRPGLIYKEVGGKTAGAKIKESEAAKEDAAVASIFGN